MNFRHVQRWLNAQLRPTSRLAQALYQARKFRPGAETAARECIELRVREAARLAASDAEITACLQALPDPRAALTRAMIDECDLVDIAAVAGFCEQTLALLTLIGEGAYATAGAPPWTAAAESAVQQIHAYSRRFHGPQGYAFRSAGDPQIAEARTAYAAALQHAAAAAADDFTAAANAGLPVLRQPEWLLTRAEYAALNVELTARFIRVIDDKPAGLVCVLKPSAARTAADRECVAAEARLLAAQTSAMIEFCGVIRAQDEGFAAALRWIAYIDCEAATARFIAAHTLVIPQLVETAELRLRAARFLPLAETLDGEFTPVTLQGAPACIIVGTNMGGKSTALLTCAFMALLVQHGLPVPALAATLCLVDEIHFFDELNEYSPGLSSFGAEMQQLQAVLEAPAGRRLMLIDEFGRTTGVAAGRALLAAAITRFLEQGDLAFVATHFSGLRELLNIPQYRLRGLPSHFEPDVSTSPAARLAELSVALDRSLVLDGEGAPESDTFRIAAALGVDGSLLTHAREIYRRTCA